MFKKENGDKTFLEGAALIISSESIITGDIKTKSDINIDGTVKGDISTIGDVLIGKDARVDGNISGNSINIAGAVTGNLSASGEVTLFANGNLTGSIKAAAIRIERDAKYEGVISIGTSVFKESAKIVKPEASAAAK